jgi:hypothetical protein
LKLLPGISTPVERPVAISAGQENCYTFPVNFPSLLSIPANAFAFPIAPFPSSAHHRTFNLSRETIQLVVITCQFPYPLLLLLFLSFMDTMRYKG